MQKVKTFRCPACKKVYNSLKTWSNHIETAHRELIPEGWTAGRYFYMLQTKKSHGSCIMCHSDTDWNEATMKYNRFCNNPACKEAYREQFKNRMINRYGKVSLLSDPEQQRKMLMAKKTSGHYDFEDGKVPYASSYEEHFLMMLDHLFRISANDIMGPSPHTYYYDYTNPEDKENEGRKFYIPEFLRPSLELEMEIKQNTSTHPKILRVDKVKEKEKDEMMKSVPGIHYIKIVDKNYEEFFRFLVEYRESIPDKTDEELKIN